MSSAPAISPLRRPRASEAVTNGFRVSVEPTYLPEQSDPDSRKYLFGYRIRIANESNRVARLMSRRWVIIDATGVRREVEGDGVIGQQPLIRPGFGHEYRSQCDLRTQWGTMEGQYTMRGDDGELFQIAIARFYLVAEPDSPAIPG